MCWRYTGADASDWYGVVLADLVFHKSLPLAITLLFWLLLACALVGLVGRQVSLKVLVVTIHPE